MFFQLIFFNGLLKIARLKNLFEFTFPPHTMSINFMHVGGAFALVGTALMVKNQLDDENYESAGYVLFEIAGVQIDLKIWLPLLIAIPLFLLGQVLATAKKTTEASPSPPAATYEIEEIEEELEVSEEEEMDESEDDDEADLIARIEARTVSGRKAATASAKKEIPKKSPVVKGSGKKSRRAKTPVKKSSVKKSAPKKLPAKKSSVKKSKSKSKSPGKKSSPSSVVISKSAKKALAAHAFAKKKKSSAKKAPKKSPVAKKAVKKTRAKTPVRAVSQVRRSRRGKKTPTKYDPAVTTDTTFF